MNSNTYPSDFDDFFNEFKDVTPIKNANVVQTARNGDSLAKQLKRKAIAVEQNLTNNYLSVEKVEPVDPYDHLSFKQDGVQDGVFKNLRLGKYKIDSVANLQSLKFEQARSQLFIHIMNSHQRGDRTILVKHGLGLHSKPFAAFLKSYVNQWLTQMPEIIAFHTALPQHGGNSAVYALLKKNQQQKSHNREIHSKR
ncbi:DNA endonuclease SmrA [Paraglaciecola aquimarina]|uniref:DNA endonuclease SmrA n=1 Tax=Paraglaciecola aquimarina TaxID=1235557 RepID=A0ABU3SX01_9ALTE|nr:DNA endonuclease SmrA [Paraglaciecola aquimarina]MDU0354513.1 DNA endonuclease SmrA [Paraglaciecola aquimarina]